MAFFNEDFLNFFIELAPNNNKDWFDANRKRYEDNIREPFKAFVQHIIDELAKEDKEYEDLEAKHCIFRINRDIRFSKDKTPYKMKVSAAIRPGGKNRRGTKGVYFELGPEHVRVYGGIFEADKEDLYLLREGIVAEPKKLKKAYSSATFKDTFGEIRGNKNKVIPKEFKETGEIEPLIYNKQWYFFTEFDADEVFNDDLDKRILDSYRAGLPVSKFFTDIIKS